MAINKENKKFVNILPIFQNTDIMDGVEYSIIFILILIPCLGVKLSWQGNIRVNKMTWKREISCNL